MFRVSSQLGWNQYERIEIESRLISQLRLPTKITILIRLKCNVIFISVMLDFPNFRSLFELSTTILLHVNALKLLIIIVHLKLSLSKLAGLLDRGTTFGKKSIKINMEMQSIFQINFFFFLWVNIVYDSF